MVARSMLKCYKYWVSPNWCSFLRNDFGEGPHRRRIAGADYSRRTMWYDTGQSAACTAVGYHADIEYFMIFLLRTPQHKLQMLFFGPDNPKKCLFLWVPWAPKSPPPQTASRSVQPFLQGTSGWPARRQTDSWSHATSVAIGKRCGLKYVMCFVHPIQKFLAVHLSLIIYHVQEKRRNYTSVANFAKCWPIYIW